MIASKCLKATSKSFAKFHLIKLQEYHAVTDLKQWPLSVVSSLNHTMNGLRKILVN